VADNVVIGNILGAGKAFQELASSDIYSLVSSDITSNLVIDEDDMASDSDTKVPTQQSVKAYVDGEIANNAADVVLISTQTASSSADITFTGLSSAYSLYAVHLTAVVPASNNVFLYFRTSTDGGSSYDSGASDYSYDIHSSGTSASATTTRVVLHGNQTGNAANEMFNGIVEIYNPSATTETFIGGRFTMKDNTGSLRVGSVAGVRNSAADVDAIQFLFSTGNIASGTFKLYGYK
jgi:hypothetical protein